MPEPPEGMVLVPAGEFTMGSGPSDHWSDQDERPQRVVHVGAFYIDQLEVTNLQFLRFLDATDWPVPPEWRTRFETPDAEFLPVTGVTWQDATAYARWAGKRLPTETEWEKAARGGDGRRFPWGEEFTSDYANNEDVLLPAGSKPLGISPYGVLDMAGNIAEWTSSVYAAYPQVESVLPGEFGGTSRSNSGEPMNLITPPFTLTDAESVAVVSKWAPDDPRRLYLTASEFADEHHRVYRGGSVNSYARFLRCANRESAGPRTRWVNVGFRCAADVSAATKP